MLSKNPDLSAKDAARLEEFSEGTLAFEMDLHKNFFSGKGDRWHRRATNAGHSAVHQLPQENRFDKASRRRSGGFTPLLLGLLSCGQVYAQASR